MHDITTAVVQNVDLGHDHYLLHFDAPEMAQAMDPAQFFMIGIPGSQTLLRRPYSVCGLPGTFEDGSPDGLQVLYRAVGTGTTLLGALKPGASITVLGPLGRGFSMPDRATRRPVLIAGGIGSAPFPAMIARLAGRGPAPTMIYGARRSEDLPLLDWFRERCEEVVVTTNDGSLGRRGLVTEPLAEILARPDRQDLQLYACGPESMLREVARLAREYAVACELALEAHMACGFGVCLGCVVPVHGDADSVNYERLCVEGPVMRAERLAW